MSQRRSRSQRLDKKIFYLANHIMTGIMIDDLTAYRGDAIVNAANERMLGGGGVDGAIHRAAGRGLVEACRKVPEVTPGVRCPTGEARITPGFDLPAKFVIHTVGPIYDDAEASAPLLEAAFRSSLELASSKGLRSVAFPAISCGVYAYPIRDAARVAVKTCMAFSEKQGEGPVTQIDFVLFAPDVYEAWVAAAQELSKGLATEDEAASDAKKMATDTAAVEQGAAEEGGAKKDEAEDKEAEKEEEEEEDAAAPMEEEGDSKAIDEAGGEDKDHAAPTAEPDKMEETCQAPDGPSAEETAKEEGEEAAKEGEEGDKAADGKGDDSASVAQEGDAMSIASTEEGKNKAGL